MQTESEEELTTGFWVYNATDRVPFDPRTFATKSEALAAIKERRAAYRRQGYYLTADGERIDPGVLELEVIAMGEYR